MQTLLRNTLKLTAVLLLIAVMFAGLAPSAAYAACAPTVSFDLWAKTGTATPYTGGPTVAIWGYALLSTDPAGLPGPVLVANQGDCVGVTLHNDNIPGSTSLLFQGQSMAPDTTGVSAGGSTTYTFLASDPGTFLYEAGLTANGQHQVAMGLYGALVVRPTGAPLQAYAGLSTAFDTEQVLVLSELDTTLNGSATPASFDMRKYAPKYFLINGKAYPGTAALAVTAGADVLLRYVNAGLTSHHMGILGLSQTVLGQDGNPYLNSHKMVSETIAPGQTLDTLVTIPAASATGTRFAVYDSNLLLRNNTGLTTYAGFGGMLTFLTVGTPPPPGPDTTGPATSSVALPLTAVNSLMTASLIASVSDVATGGSNVTAAEYFIDTTAANGSGTGMSGTFGTPGPIAVSATISGATIAGLSTGNHIVYVHGLDSAGNWGSFTLGVLKVDNTPPTVVSPSLSPNPTNGQVNVSLTATATDSVTGNSNIAAAEYWIDSGAHIAMTVSVSAPISGISATIPAGTVLALTPGAHTVHIRSMDVLNTAWGPETTITLNVDKTEPATSAVSATYNPNNGTKPFNTTVQAVRVSATFSDVSSGGSNIAAGEGFLDTIGTTGTGFVFVANDGNFNSPTETGYADIPLVVINTLSTGNHTIHVHGKDAAGNWGAMGTVVLVIDRTPPTFTGISLAPNPTAGAANVTLTVIGASDVSGIAGGEYWFGTTNPAPGGGTAFSGLTSSIPVGSLLPGTYTVRARVRDAAGNWSTNINGATLTVSQPPIYISTFGNTNPPGAGGTADDADIYFYNGAAFSRVIDASTAPYSLPGGANVDGFDRVSATQFYMSFNGTVTVPGIGTVQDEDIVEYNAGTWTLYFDGTPAARGLSGSDLDAISIVGGILYFSTDDADVPTGVSGGGDDADIYSWNGVSFSRVFDASANGLPGGADVDGFVRVDATHFYMSFNTDTVVPVLGTVQDEDIVYYNAGIWSVYYDGTAVGLTAGNLDIDAFDLP